MARQRIMAPARGNGGRSRTYTLRISRRKGWAPKGTDATAPDKVVLTIAGDYLDDAGFGDYIAFEFDDETGEMFIVNVDDTSQAAGALLAKLRDEKFSGKATGYRQAYVTLPDHIDEKVKPGKFYPADVNRVDGETAFAIAITDPAPKKAPAPKRARKRAAAK